jgi:hypothetical protein
MAFDDDVFFPQLFPQCAVGCDEWLLANEDSPFNDTDGLVDWVFVMGSGDECADEAQLVDLSFFNAKAGLE